MKRSICFSIALVLAAAFSTAQGQGGAANPSADEQKLAQAINAAPDAVGKLKAATDFIKKYPKSTLRPQVARSLIDQILGVTDATQKITSAQSYRDAFREPSEQEMIMPVLIEGLAQAKRPDEAFAAGTEFLGRSPDSLLVLVQLLSAATEEAKNKNAKFVPQGLQHGAHAIQLIETDKKPAELDAVEWPKYKTVVLPSLYQSIGLLNLVKGDRVQAKASYTKAAELAPSEPFNLVMLAGMLNDDYQTQAKAYQAMPAGPARDAELKKVQALLDSVIDAYARAIAVSEGHANLQQVRQQYLQDLEAYYKYRHNGSTEGMQALIDKYKVAPKP